MDAADYKNIQLDESTNPTKTVKVNVPLSCSVVSRGVLSIYQGTSDCYGYNR